VQSLKDAVAITRGEMAPARMFVVEADSLNVRAVREKPAFRKANLPACYG